MAEIQVERKPERNVAAWIVGVVLVLLLAGVAWYFLMGPGEVWLERGGPPEGPGQVLPRPGGP